MNPSRNYESSLAVGLLPDGTLTCPDDVCKNEELKCALEAYGPIRPGDVATLVLLDGWRRVHVTPIDNHDQSEVLRACGSVAHVASGEVVDTIHLATAPPNPHDAVMGYRLGAENPVPLSIDSEEAEIVAEMVLWARDLVNRPPNLKSPSVVADEVAARVAPGLRVEIMDQRALIVAGCGGILAVAAGSSHEPLMLDLSYIPETPVANVAFVGKGVVFDSGGLSIKAADEMYRMKEDISGAAAVIGSTFAISRLGLPIAVRALVPLVENVIGPAAMRPGDVIETAAEISVEIVSTDAEGRLILADALTLAAQHSPDLIVDVASLTHAAETALGPNIAAVFADPESVSDLIVGAGRNGREQFWPLPLDPNLDQRLHSDVADIKNANPGKPGGAISAAMFLRHFVDGRPWAHLDLGGTIWQDHRDGHLRKGATGFGVRSLTALAHILSSPKSRPG